MNLLDFLAAAVRSVWDNTPKYERPYVQHCLEGAGAYRDSHLRIWWTDGSHAYASLHYPAVINSDDLLAPRLERAS